MSNPYIVRRNAYTDLITSPWLAAESYATFDLNCPDDRLQKMLIDELEKDRDHWNQAPWNLQEIDEKNLKFLFGDQTKDKKLQDEIFTDNRLFSATRAILSYATGRLAVPEILPSRSDDKYVRMARSIQMALYQHSLEEQVDDKTRAAVLNLIVRKRGGLKLRYDPNAGIYGDLVTEVFNPEDIIVDRYAAYLDNPRKIYHRVRCTVDELVTKFPKKRAEILSCFNIVQGRFTQMNKYVTYYECWFTYLDGQGKPREAVAWFLHDPRQLILDKMPNPNWIYTGDDEEDKQTNVLYCPPKPFVFFNHINAGHSFIDETCLFEQAKPQQELLNKRLKQINDNADYANGRWIGSKRAWDQADMVKMVNKGSKTVGLVDADDVNKAFANVAAQAFPSYVYNTLNDAKGEVDTMMGTPSVFRGANPESQDTLGRDMMVKQQAGMLQDDLVRAVSQGMERYYKIKLQMMRVYYTDDYWFQVKGGDGKFDFVMLNSDTIDSNVRIGVQVDSTLPLDKEAIRANALQLARMNRIDQLTLLEDLGVPDPEIRTERFLRSQIDLYTYMQSVEQKMDNNDAEVDIMLLEAGKEPTERDAYDENYLNYFNHYLTTNRFTNLPQQVKQAVVTFLASVQHIAVQSANLQTTMLNDAGIVNRPPIFPLPKRTMNIRLVGNMDPQQTQQIAQSEGQMFTPVTQAQQAQSPGNAPQAVEPGK